MATIGLIGSGHIGSTVARLAVDAGHDVVLSNSRGPETLADLVADLGDHARAATAAEAAAVRPAMKPKVIAGPSVPPAPQYAWPVGDAMQLPAPNRPGMGEPSGRSTRASGPITGPPQVSSVAGPRIAQ